MHRYVGLDVHLRSTTIAVISATGKRIKTMVVETNGQALVEAMRLTPGTLHIGLEACKHPIGSRSCGFHGGPEPSRSNSEAGDTFAVRPRSPGHAVGGVDTRLL
jgi:hypothetical protein